MKNLLSGTFARWFGDFFLLELSVFAYFVLLFHEKWLALHKIHTKKQ